MDEREFGGDSRPGFMSAAESARRAAASVLARRSFALSDGVQDLSFEWMPLAGFWIATATVDGRGGDPVRIDHGRMAAFFAAPPHTEN